MDHIVGFTIYRGLGKQVAKKLREVNGEVLELFPWLNKKSMRVGEVTIVVWGHGDLKKSVKKSGGELWLVCGSAIFPSGWRFVEKQKEKVLRDLKLEDRYVLVRVKPGGSVEFWTDWCGSLSVFYGCEGRSGLVASTLEPVVVEGLALKTNNVDELAMVCLLYLGYFVSDLTLFESMKVVPADSYLKVSSKNKVSRRQLWEVEPGWEHFGKSVGEVVKDYEDLIEEVVVSRLEGAAWILPLSGGLDSRLVAAIGHAHGIVFDTYTYGNKGWIEVRVARQISEKLGLPWRRIETGDYLRKYTKKWLLWYGSSLHAHGMYQFPMLEYFRNHRMDNGIVSGLMGDPLVGSHHKVLLSAGASKPLASLASLGVMASKTQVGKMLGRPQKVEKRLNELNELLHEEMKTYRGGRFQKLFYLDTWTRQSRFVTYQAQMYDYYNGVTAPFVDKKYARFCLSLPLTLLGGRKLQKAYVVKRFPELAKISGTFGPPPLLSLGYRSKMVIRNLLSKSIPLGTQIKMGLADESNLIQSKAIEESREKSFWPLGEYNKDGVGPFDANRVRYLVEQVLSKKNNEVAYNQLRSIQAVLYRIS